MGFGRPAQWRQPSNADWTAIAARSREALSLHQSPHAGARRALVDEFCGLAERNGSERLGTDRIGSEAERCYHTINHGLILPNFLISDGTDRIG